MLFIVLYVINMYELLKRNICQTIVKKMYTFDIFE